MLSARTLLLLTALLSCSAARAASFEQLQIGYGGQGKPGRWLPVTALVSDLPAGQQVELQLTAPDNRGDLLVRTVATGTVSSDGEILLSGFCRLGRLTGQLRIELVTDDSALLTRSVNFGPELSVDTDQAVQTSLATRKLDPVTLMTVGPLEGMDEFLRNVAVFSAPGPPVVQHLQLSSLNQLPADERGLDMVDLLLLTDDFAISSQQTNALRRWVYTGGHLIVSSGATINELQETPLGQWLNGSFDFADQPQDIRRFSSLEGYVSGASRIQTSLQNRSAWPVARMQSDQVAVVVDSIDGPLIGRRSIGGGLVTVVAVDVNRLPLKNWTSLPQFYEKLLLGEKLTREKVTRTRTSRISQSGISDVSTQLLATVDAEPVGGQWSTWSVMAMVVIWLAAIGPLDYLIVSRLLKKPHLTWITFPLMIVAGVALILSFSGDNNTAHLTQYQIVDYFIDGDEHRLTAHGWVSISSPETLRSDLRAVPAVPTSTGEGKDGTASPDEDRSEESRSLLTWSGRAEDVFGAMYREGGIGLGRQTFYQKHQQDDQLQQVPLLTGGSRAFEVRYGDVSPAVMNSNLKVSGFGLLNGSFSHSLPGPIRNWIVVHGNRAYRPTNEDSAVLAPGTEWNSQSPGIISVELKGYLSAERRIDNPGRDSSNPFNKQTSLQAQSPYNIRSRDRMYITAMVSFFEAAGGAEYVELSNAQLRDLEISSTIRLNHAVLLGFVDSDQPMVQSDDLEFGSINSQTMVRLFIPVQRQPADSLAKSREEADKEN